MGLVNGPVVLEKKLAVLVSLALVVGVSLLASSAQAANPFAPTNDWQLQSPPQPPSTAYGGSSAFDEANGEIVYFGGESGSGYSNETWTWNGISWTLETPAHKPPARDLAAMVFDPSSGRVLLFGGTEYGSNYGDTWAWDGTDWIQLSPATSPSPRVGPAMAFDPSTGRILLFGGASHTTGTFFNDTWAWEGNTWTQLSPASSPSTRNGHVMSSDPANGEIVLYGGNLQGSRLSDTWTWDGSNWSQESPATNPGGRSWAAMDFNPALGLTVLFSGLGTWTDSTWAWDGSQWTVLSPATDPDIQRGPAMSFDPSMGDLVSVGGLANGSTTDQTWAYGPPADVTGNWSEESPAHRPPAMGGAAMAFDQANGEIVLFGGSAATYLDETWVWDGDDWTRKHPAHSPPARARASMAFDSASGEVVMFGGASSGLVRRNDTWVWDGTDWTQKSPATVPAGRSDAAMAFDPASGRVVMFGGFDGEETDETWTWNGTDWTQRSPATVPEPRSAASMAFDPANGELLMFGGNGGNPFMSDTWAWNGSNWTRKSPATEPPGRLSSSMAFSPATGTTILFGGYSLGAPRNDTWSWDGSDWSKLTPATSPAARSTASTAFDPSSGSIVLFGGTGDWDDTWTFALEVGSPAAEITAPADGGNYSIGETVATAFSCEDAPGGPGITSCEDSNGDAAPSGALDTSALGSQTYTVTATSANGRTDSAQIDYTIGQAEPTIATAGAEAQIVIGGTLRVDADLANGYQPGGEITFRAYGPGDETCSGAPVFISTVTATGNGLYYEPGFKPGVPGTYRWVTSYGGDTNNQPAASVCGAEGSVTDVVKGMVKFNAAGATSGKLGESISMKVTLTGGEAPTGDIVFRAYGPSDASCSGSPAFESTPVPVSGPGEYSSPDFTPTVAGTYRWTASYGGDDDNDPAATGCDSSGSVSTVTGPKCPKARPGLTLTGFGLKPPFGNAKPVFGARVAFTSRNAVVKFTPSMTYRVRGKTRTVKLKTRTRKVNGRLKLRFRAPQRLKRDLRKAGIRVRRAPVTFTVKARIRPQGSGAKCFRNLGTRGLKTRLVNVSSRVALRSLRS